jgi:hypothetical protein
MNKNRNSDFLRVHQTYSYGKTILDICTLYTVYSIRSTDLLQQGQEAYLPKKR